MLHNPDKKKRRGGDLSFLFEQTRVVQAQKANEQLGVTEAAKVDKPCELDLGDLGEFDWTGILKKAFPKADDLLAKLDPESPVGTEAVDCQPCDEELPKSDRDELENDNGDEQASEEADAQGDKEKEEQEKDDEEEEEEDEEEDEDEDEEEEEKGKKGKKLPKITPVDVFDYFVKVGLDYRGQFQSCTDIIGKEVETKATIDFGAALLPGTTAALGVSGSAIAGQATIISVLVNHSRGEDPNSSLQYVGPLCLARMVGGYFEAKIKADAEIGFKAPELTPEIDGLEDVVAWKVRAKAKATVAANATVGGYYMHVSDPAPRYYATRESLRNDFVRLPLWNKDKLLLKRRVCDFLNRASWNPKHPHPFERTLRPWVPDADTCITHLQEGIEKLEEWKTRAVLLHTVDKNRENTRAASKAIIKQIREVKRARRNTTNDAKESLEKLQTHLKDTRAQWCPFTDEERILLGWAKRYEKTLEKLKTIDPKTQSNPKRFEQQFENVREVVDRFLHGPETYTSSVKFHSTRGHIGSDELYALLTKRIDALEAWRKIVRKLSKRQRRLLYKARQFRNRLIPFFRKKMPTAADCSLQLFTGGIGGGLDVQGSASVEGAITMRGQEKKMDASVKVSLLNAEGSYRKARYRLQTHTWVAKTQSVMILKPQPKKPKRPKLKKLMMTQETTITYAQTKLDLFKVEANAGGEKMERQPEFAANAGKKATLNSIFYESGVAFWYPPGPGETAPRLHEEGSGYSVGLSVLIENLVEQGERDNDNKLKVGKPPPRRHKPVDLNNSTTLNVSTSNVDASFWSAEKSIQSVNRSALLEPQTSAVKLRETESAKAFRQALAGQLGVTRQQLEEFLAIEGVSVSEDLASDPNFQPEALLIEASFKGKPKLVRDADSGELERFRDDMIKGQKDEERHKNLEAIRLRYRITDQTEDKQARFKLGFKWLGTSFSIELSDIYKAGSEGVVDVATVFFGKAEEFGAREGGSLAVQGYNMTVPPVVLVCQ